MGAKMKDFIKWDGGKEDIVLKHPSFFWKTKAWYRGQKRERRKEKAFDDLVYRTEGFRLIHVQIARQSQAREGTQLSMKLVNPWQDKNVANHVKKQGYYTVSHVWGPPGTLRQVRIPVMDPKDGGRHVVLRIRPDKVNTMLGLLVSQGTETYWWVDIICAQVSTPLVHMGAIYKQCTMCFAMVAVQDDGTLRDFEPLQKIFDSYDRALERRPGPACVVPLEEYVPGVLRRIAEWTTVTPKTDWYYLLNLVFPQPQPMPTDLRQIRVLDQRAFGILLQCPWWDRVWTLQEVALPPRLRFVNESLHDISGLRNKDSFVDRDLLVDILLSVQSIVSCIHRLRDSKKPPKEILEYTAWDKFDAYRAVLDQRISAIADSQGLFPEPMFDVIGLKGLTLASRDIVLASFAVSKRKCTDPTDYVYGTLGLLNFDIPRLSDPKAVWEAFKKELLRVRAMDIKDIDLTKATCMADVYGQFAFD